MEKSEASLNFLSLEIAISVYYKRFLKYEHVFGMCLIWTSIIIFLNPLSVLIPFNLYFLFSGYVKKYSASLSLGAIGSLSFFSVFGD